LDDDPSALTARAAFRPVVAVVAAIVGLLASEDGRPDKRNVSTNADHPFVKRKTVPGTAGHEYVAQAGKP
jgi:hypothetical protein